MNILFLGNSLIYYNELPQVFENLARAAGKDCSVQSVTKGSATISDFANPETVVGEKALPMLKNQPWDYVIIEPSRRISPFESTVKEAELASAKKIREMALAEGGDVLLYSVWGNNNGSVKEFRAEASMHFKKVESHPIERKSHTAFMQRINREFSEALDGVKVAEAGYAFENLIAAYPDINPYYPDERHPSLIGTYLAACMIYTTMFGERVKNIPYTADLPDAEKLKEIADATAFDGRVPTL